MDLHRQASLMGGGEVVDGGAVVAHSVGNPGRRQPRAVGGVAVVAECGQIVVLALGVWSVDLQIEVAASEDVQVIWGTAHAPSAKAISVRESGGRYTHRTQHE